MESFLIRSILLFYTIHQRTAMLHGHPFPFHIRYIQSIRDRKYINTKREYKVLESQIH